MPKKTTFSDALRQAIERSELTRYRIAQQTGIAESVLSRFVNRQTNLSLANIDRLCEALGLRLVEGEAVSDQPSAVSQRRAKRKAEKSRQ